MKRTITIRKALSLLLVLLMLFSMLPAALLGAAAVPDEGLAAALASAKSYIDALTINNSSNVPSTVVPTFRTHFTWDHERRENSSSYLYEWSYYNGVVFEGLDDVYDATNEAVYKNYVHDYLSAMINESTGAWLKCTNNTSKDAAGFVSTHGLDCYKTASLLLDYYDLTGKQGYLTMAQTLYNDLTVTNAGRSVESLGWNYEHTWNTSNYRVWLDGIYMAQPFMAEYAARINDTAQLDKIASRFAWIGANMVDADGLYYHAAASRNSTAPSGTYWLRAVGWYAMAMVDVMESLDRIGYDISAMKTQFKALVDNMLKVQDPTTHMWRNDIKGNTSSNRLETSGSSMLAYSMMKAVRLGWIDAAYADDASDIFVGIVTNKLKNNALTDICFIGAPGSSNSTFYDDEGKGVGPFIMAYSEMLRYANDVEEEITSTVTLNANDGIIADGKNVTSYVHGVGAALPGENDITRENHRFDGWFADPNFSGSAVTAITAEDTGDKVFYAKWTDITPPPVETPAAYLFDFGQTSSPVMSDWTPVLINGNTGSSGTVYTEALGYGITNVSGLISRNRTKNTPSANGMECDWIGRGSLNEWEFKVDLPNGAYTVLVYCTDMMAGTRNNITIKIEGNQLCDITTEYENGNQMHYQVFEPVTVADGQMNFIFSDTQAYVNGIEIYPYSEVTPLVSVTNPDTIYVYDGGALPAFPTTVTAQLINTDVVSAPVDGWVSDNPFRADAFGEYVYTANVLGVAGEFANPSGLTATLTVSHLRVPFVASVESPASIMAYSGIENAVFPTETSVVLNDGQKATASVGAWSCPSFNPASYGVYTFTAPLLASERFDNPNGLTASVKVNYFEEKNPLDTTARSMEWLDRGVIALKNGSNGIFVSWRLLASEYATNIAFNLYRNGVKINDAPISTKTSFTDAAGKPGDQYVVETLLNGTSQLSKPFTALENDYLQINLQNPGVRPVITGAGSGGTYSPNDASAADVDGDGEYELLIKWNPSNAIDSASGKVTSPTIFDCYKLDGTILWRVNLGYNITSGQHFSPFLFYDFDEDGKAEFIVKTADGTKAYRPNAQGVMDESNDCLLGIVGDPTKDGAYVAYSGNLSPEGSGKTGHIWGGPEYLTAFDGETGAIISTTDYDAPVGSSSQWGDSSYNRADRFNAAVCYVPNPADNAKSIPAAIMNRGYYSKTVVMAYVLANDVLSKVWRFDSANFANTAGKGVHHAAGADVDGDGFDEFVLGSVVIDHDGTPLWSKNGSNGTTSLGHGDALHVAAMIPGTTALQVFQPYEDSPYRMNMCFSDANSGKDIFGAKWVDRDVGRGLAANITPAPGFELWAQYPSSESMEAAGSIYNVYGEVIAAEKPYGMTCNWRSYWDGDLLSELPDGENPGAADPAGTAMTIWKYDWENNEIVNTGVFAGTATNNSTKNVPCLSADLLGDWREEIVVRTSNDQAIRIYSTVIETDYMIYTLMHDPVYRLSVARQNTSYNQPPALGYYLGEDNKEQVLAMELPTSNIFYTNAPAEPSDPSEPMASTDKSVYTTEEAITVTVKIPDSVSMVYLANEAGNGLASERSMQNNGDGTCTWTLTLTLGTVGSRTLSVWADGESTDLSVTFDVVYPQAAGEPVILSLLPPLNIRANEAFTVEIITNQYAEAVRLFNEAGVGLIPSACTYVENGDKRVWSYTVAVGTSGQRLFTAKAAAADRVYVGNVLASLYVA